MLILDSENNEENIALLSLKDKVKVEVKLIRDLKKLFTQIINDIDDKMNGKSLKKKFINIETEYKEQIEELLRSSYETASNLANNRMIKDKLLNELLSKDEILRIQQMTDEKIEKYINKRIRSQGKEILETTKNNLEQSRSFVNRVIEDEGLDLATEEIDSLILDNFTQRVMNRTETIAVTETQNMYEQAKQIQMGLVSEKINSSASAQKRWSSILDQKTRPAHAAAHGQRVPIEQAYTVDGEMLMFPGDTSLGASISNVANCRCESMMVLI